jgi:hypothetical protein
VPLLETETVASSKLHEDAAETIVALERRREDTKLLRTLIFAVTELSWRRASDRWLQRTPGQLTFRVRGYVGLTTWRVRRRHSRPPAASPNALFGTTLTNTSNHVLTAP